jgi:hypothetical protein
VKAERESTRLMEVRLVDVLVASPLLLPVLAVDLNGGIRASLAWVWVVVVIVGRAGTGDPCLGAVG